MKIHNALLLAALWCGACASKPPPGSVHLNTLITQDGLKLFELALPRASHAEREPGEHRPEPGFSEGRVLALLETALAETHYCRAGYVLLGRYAGETMGRVRGECKDRATEEDRAHFPDTIARW